MNYVVIMLIVIVSNIASIYFAGNRTKNLIKQSEDKIWEYLKLRNKTEAVKTKSGLTRKL